VTGDQPPRWYFSPTPSPVPRPPSLQHPHLSSGLQLSPMSHPVWPSPPHQRPHPAGDPRLGGARALHAHGRYSARRKRMRRGSSPREWWPRTSRIWRVHSTWAWSSASHRRAVGTTLVSKFFCTLPLWGFRGDSPMDYGDAFPCCFSGANRSNSCCLWEAGVDWCSVKERVCWWQLNGLAIWSMGEVSCIQKSIYESIESFCVTVFR
jgi:hypothetical protein